MRAEVSIFGIRHHGPGSARRLVEALDELRPSLVLIEGPADASDLLPMLADAAMTPPVALLTYAADDPGRAIFWPFGYFRRNTKPRAGRRAMARRCASSTFRQVGV